MTSLAVVDLGIERLVHLDQRIDANETDALRARWEFGQHMVAAADENGRLPHKYLAELAQRTGKSRTELTYRKQFAERYPDETKMLNAVSIFPAWRELAKSFKSASDPTAEDADDDGNATSAVLQGTFSTIVADPPWRYGNTSTRGAAEDHYPTMSIEELCALDVARERAADEAHLYLWSTAGHLPDAFAVMAAWGFEYKTYLVWVKPQMGMGNYFRVSTELVLFGVKGGIRTNDRGLRNHFEAKRGKHSAKPRVFRELVKKASPGPYLELFSRCSKDTLLTGCDCSACSDGWTTWGNQA